MLHKHRLPMVPVLKALQRPPLNLAKLIRMKLMILPLRGLRSLLLKTPKVFLNSPIRVKAFFVIQMVVKSTKFTSQESQESSQDSENFSQFSDQSQSILCNANGSVINQSNNDDVVVVLAEGLSGGTQDEVEDMDSSVCHKRTRGVEFAVPARPSRHRSCSGDFRKKSHGDSSSPSPSRGKHSGLPRIVGASPRRS